MHNSRIRSLFAVLALAGCLLWAAPSAAAEAVDLGDEGITMAVENELFYDKAVDQDRIDVVTVDGIVTLSGTTRNILAKERAARLAETVRGVRSVVNRIEVAPPVVRDDVEVLRDIETALLMDPAAESYEVIPAVQDGSVTLTGSVQSWQEKRLAGRVARGVRGVTEVRNEITVEYEMDRPDGEILTEVQGALRWDAYVDHALIDVTVDNGQVVLAGTVGSAAEKRRAEADAWVVGTTQVDATGLEVAYWARDPLLRGDKYEDVTDREIEAAIRDALLYHPRVYSFDLSITVENGIATLRGVVNNISARRAAGDVARRTVGVRAVQNRIKVRPSTPTDEEIAERIRNALLRDPILERYEVDVSVEDGVVTLRGTVDSTAEKSAADKVSAGIYGARSVRNRLRVEREDPPIFQPYLDELYVYDAEWFRYDPPPTMTTDGLIAEQIRSEFFWSPFVNSDNVFVSVNNGTAYLTGNVESALERDSAIENAYEGGAVDVKTKITIGGGIDYE